MLIDDKTHNEISEATRILASNYGRRVSSREAIHELLGRKVAYLVLKPEIRSCINEFVGQIASNRDVKGVMLFGSVARNSYSSYSDIDLLIVLNGRALEHFESINDLIESVDHLRKPLLKLELHLRITPMLLSEKDLHSFRPIYITFAEEGIVLYEKNEVLTNFISEVKREVAYESGLVNNVVVIRWKMKAKQKGRKNMKNTRSHRKKS
jgi:predicted nucleotidyltransferase